MSYIQNYGFSKTQINNGKYNEVEWIGDYDGKIANINIDINNNGSRDIVSMKLNNNDLVQLFGVQPVQIPLEKRLMNDFLSKPMVLEGALKTRHRRHHRSRSRRHRRHRKKSHRRHSN